MRGERFRGAVVGALVATHLPDRSHQTEITAFVDAQLGRMPVHLRTPVLLVEALLRARAAGSPDVGRLVAGWAVSRVPPVRQYVRLIRSLVLFRDFEARYPVARTAWA